MAVSDAYPHAKENIVSLRTVLAVVVVGIATSACQASLTSQGSVVRPVTDGQKERACQFLKIVTGSESAGFSREKNVESAMNKARNAVAAAGGNAMKIVQQSSDNNGTSVTAEALKCDVSKL